MLTFSIHMLIKSDVLQSTVALTDLFFDQLAEAIVHDLDVHLSLF